MTLARKRDSGSTICCASEASIKARIERAFTGSTRPGEERWVYGREGKPCRRCGTRIRKGSLGDTPLTERDTYWCPRCQT